MATLQMYNHILFCLHPFTYLQFESKTLKDTYYYHHNHIRFRRQIMSELVGSGVQIYQFPTDDETVAEVNANMNVSCIDPGIVGLILLFIFRLQRADQVK